MAVVFASKTVR